MEPNLASALAPMPPLLGACGVSGACMLPSEGSAGARNVAARLLSSASTLAAIAASERGMLSEG